MGIRPGQAAGISIDVEEVPVRTIFIPPLDGNSPQTEDSFIQQLRAQIGPTQIGFFIQIYSTKFICGQTAAINPSVVPGIYRTNITVVNVSVATTQIAKAAVITPPQRDFVFNPSNTVFATAELMGPLQALKIDCTDIRDLLGGNSDPLIEGVVFILLILEEPLDLLKVTATYTALHPENLM